MSNGGIYLIIHKPTGKVYVGQAISYLRRWKKHSEDLDSGLHHNYKLQSLWTRDGPSAFEFKKLRLLPDGLTALERQRWLVRMERESWDFYRKSDLALNIASPEIVETPDALAEYKLERKNTTSELTAHIKSLKPQIEEAQLNFRTKSRDEYEFRMAFEKAWALLKRNSGWRGFLFGKTTSTPVEILKREAERRAAELINAELATRHANDLLQSLEKQRKELYRSYPGNQDRRIRGTDLFLFTRQKNKTTIR